MPDLNPRAAAKRPIRSTCDGFRSGAGVVFAAGPQLPKAMGFCAGNYPGESSASFAAEIKLAIDPPGLWRLRENK